MTVKLRYKQPAGDKSQLIAGSGQTPPFSLARRLANSSLPLP